MSDEKNWEQATLDAVRDHEKRLTVLEVGMETLQSTQMQLTRELAENTATTKAIKEDTKTMVELGVGLKAISKIAVWVGSIATAVAAIVGLILAIQQGFIK